MKEKTIFVCQACLVIVFPLFSFCFLSTNLGQLELDKFKAKFGPLYENVDIPEQTKKYKHSTYLHVVLFLVKRLIIAVVTVFLNFLPPVQIAVSIYLTLVSSYFTVTTQPMELWYLNWIELANDFLFISVNYFMFLFTDFVTLPTIRNSIGDFCFNYLLTYLSGICLFIVFMTILTLIKFRQDRIRKQRMLTLSLNKDQVLEDKKVKKKEKELEKDDARTDRLSLTEQGSVFVQEEKKIEDEPPSK